MDDEVEVVIDQARANDCYGVLADTTIRRLNRLAGGNPEDTSVLVVVELSTASDTAPASGRVQYVGCVAELTATQRIPSFKRADDRVKPGQIWLSPAFASDLALSNKQVVTIAPVRGPPPAATVTVAPATVDDSEVVEINALRIEATLLQYLRVVYVGQQVTVPVHQGVCARIEVQRITTVGASASYNREVRGPCVLCDGTELHVATRPRPTAASGQSSTLKVVNAGIFRIVPLFLSAPPAGAPSSAESIVCLTPGLAAALGWISGQSLALLHLSEIAFCDARVEPSLIRQKAFRGLVHVCAVDRGEQPPFGEPNDEPNVLHLVLPQARSRELGATFPFGRVLASVTVPESVTKTVLEFLQDVASEASPGAPPSVHAADYDALVAVHGAVPQQLLSCLPSSAAATANNVLLCGARGSGRTTLSISCARKAQLYTRYISCEESSSTLSAIQTCAVACLLNAPSVIILDGLEKIAPAQVEGHVTSISSATFASLESVTLLPALGTAFSPRSDDTSPCLARLSSSVACIGIAPHKDQLYEGLRTSNIFHQVVKVEPLTGDGRVTMVQQELESCSLAFELLTRSDAAMRRQIQEATENFTPFDVKGFCRRLRHEHDAVLASNSEEPIPFKELLSRVGSKFQSLAQEGAQLSKPSSDDAAATWDDIGGLPEVKKQLYDTLVLPSKLPKLFANLPLKSRSGLLLFGPSGCGKTYAVRIAVAAENLRCITVNGPEIFGKYIGQSEQKVREIFERAQAAAPCVIFFDEFDSVAPQRGNDNTGVTDRVVNQLLCYLDGVEARKDVFVVASSSRPDLIDAALLRPGRLDRAVYCPMPSAEERLEILRAHLRKLNHSVSPGTLQNVAEQTVGWTSADLAALVATANMKMVSKLIDLSAEMRAMNIPASENSRAASAVSAASMPYVVLQGDSQEQRKAMDKLIRQEADAAVGPSASVGNTMAAPLLTDDALIDGWKSSKRSMSVRDIQRQEELFHQFMRSREPTASVSGPPRPAVQPGSRLTFS